jgi:2-polyprenyl-6-methoxyphenol hydroxylase-like FAD-dependent oxidoreductase
LTLGNLLQQTNPAIYFRIFERDTATDSRGQGYSISLRDSGGLIPLWQLGLYDEIRQASRTISNFAFLTAQESHSLLNLPEKSNSPRATLFVPRDKLRAILLHSIQDQLVFNCQCCGFSESGGRPTALFTDGESEVADLVIACDSINSTISQQMIGDAPHYLGISSISGGVTADFNDPRLAEGSLMIIGTGAGLYIAKEGEAIAWSLSMQTAKDAFEGMAASALQERVLAVIKNWHDPIPDLIAHTALETIGVRGIYDKEPLKQVYRRQVALLGDAAHPMTPFRGECANMAMLDGLVLSKLLSTVTQPNQLAGILASYQTEMIKRTRKAVLQSRQAALEIHSRKRLTVAVRDIKWRMLNKLIASAPPR